MMRDSEMAGLAMTLSRDARVNVTLGGDSSYCSADGSHIHIARMPNTPLGRMLMTGLVFHEVGHKNHTRGARPPGLLGEMTNVIEDVRVELLTIHERPGTSYDLEAVTIYYTQKGSLAPKDLPSALLGLVMAYGRSVLLQQSTLSDLIEPCRRMLAQALGDRFVEQIEEILGQNFAELASTIDARRMAERLIGILEHQKSTEQPVPVEDQQPNSPVGDPGNGSTLEIGEEKNEPETDEETSGDNAPVQEKPGKPEENPTPTDADASLIKRPTTDEINEMLLTGTGGYGDLSEMMIRELDTLAAQTPESVLKTLPELPAVGRVTLTRNRLDEVEALTACSRMRARLLTLLQAQKLQQKNYGSSGRKLAHRRLVRMAMGDPRIFSRKVETQALHTAVVLLLDNSGSMADQVISGPKRYEVANPAAFALHHALAGLSGVKVASVAFASYDSRPEVNILVDFGERPDSRYFNILPDGGTPTHRALWSARATLLQRPESRKIILLITDGYPADLEATMAATSRCERDGIEIAAIGIDTESVRRYWNIHRVIQNLPELPMAMFDVMEMLLEQKKT